MDSALSGESISCQLLSDDAVMDNCLSALNVWPSVVLMEIPSSKGFQPIAVMLSAPGIVMMYVPSSPPPDDELLMVRVIFVL